MRPVIKGGIALFTPQGFLDSDQAASFLSLADLKFIESSAPKAIFVSLAKVIYFNKKGIDNIIAILEKFRAERKEISVGFCDYSQKIFTTLLSMFDKDIRINLFKDQTAMSLFLGEANAEDISKILLWNDDSTQKSTMLIKLYERGINATSPSTKEEFNKMRNSGDYSYILNNCYLGNFASGFSSQKVGNVIIYKFEGFVDAKSIDKFDLMYHHYSLNIGFKLFVFDFEKVVAINIHGVSFLNKLAMDGAEFNATIAIANLDNNATGAKLIDDMKDYGIMFYDVLEDFLKEVDEDGFEMDSGVVVAKKKRHITKTLVAQLPLFINACVHSLNTLTNSQAIKQSVDVQELNIKNDIDQSSLIASSIGFYGELDGMIILVFSKSIAKKACFLFIGEKVEDEDEVKDAMQEFINIIGGQSKAMLSDENIKINITLPNLFDSVEQLQDTIKENKGIQVVLEFDSEPFYFYLTR